MRSTLAKKSFGQHFLKDQHVLDKTCMIIAGLETPNLLEIGPGQGALTEHLLVLQKKLLCIEADRDMQDHLIHKNILKPDQLIRQDVLKVNFNSLFEEEEFIVCGNFPYNISSQILIQTLQSASKIPYLVGMFQKEVALRITAKPGTKEYGTLSVLAQLLYDAERCFDIAPGAFSPPPKVTSSVVLLKRKTHLLPNAKFRGIQKLVRHSFQFRRKTLRNNLKSYVSKPDTLTDSFFEQRAEVLSPQDYIMLYDRLISDHSNSESIMSQK